MNKKDAYREGVDQGTAAAEAVILEHEAGENLEDAAFEAEELNRQYSPFEFFAHDVNDCGDRAEGLWEAYDKGVAAGIKAALKGK